jgi:hypothetical protein
MFKKLYDKFVRKKGKQKKTEDSLIKLNNALRPSKDIEVVYEEINEHKIKGVIYKLGDKVICRSNECDPLMVGSIIEWWDNNGKWTNPIPQIKDDLDGQVWTHMGTIVHYTDELFNTLKPMRPLEQWNYLLPDNVKEIYSYSEGDMDRKEKQYDNVQKNREKLV